MKKPKNQEVILKGDLSIGKEVKVIEDGEGAVIFKNCNRFFVDGDVHFESTDKRSPLVTKADEALDYCSSCIHGAEPADMPPCSECSKNFDSKWEDIQGET